MKSPTSLGLLILVLAIAAFLRLYQLASAPTGLYHDEAIEGNSCLENLEQHRLHVFYAENGGREGLYVDVATLAVSAFGNTAWALRLPAALFGILTVWGVYLVASEWLSPRVGLLAAFFLATSFWHVLLSRLAFRAIAAPVFLLFAVYLVRRGLRGRAWLWAAAGLVYGLGFYTYIAYRATPLLMVAVLVYAWRAGASRKALALFVASAIVAAMPLAWYFVQHPDDLLGRMSQVSVTNSAHPAWEVVLNTWRTGRMFFTRGDRNWRQNVAYRAELYWPVAILFLGGIVVALRGRRMWFLMLWMAVGALPAVLSDEAVPHALRSILMAPPAMMLAALGADWVAERLPRIAVMVAGGAMAVALGYQPFQVYFEDWAPRPEVAAAMEADAAAAAVKINALPRPELKVVAIEGGGAYLGSLPVEAADIQYLTRSYTARQQAETHIQYVDKCPANGATVCLKFRAGM